MSNMSRWGLLAIAVLVTGATGCPEPKTAHELAGDLRSPDAEVRRDAANDLRGATTAEAVAALSAAVPRENDPEACEAELATLGYSGAPEAYPAIVSRLQDPNPRIQAAAQRALQEWNFVTGNLPPDQPTPSQFGAPLPGGPSEPDVYVGTGVYVEQDVGGTPHQRYVPRRVPATPTRRPAK
jgi:hypothetical protein